MTSTVQTQSEYRNLPLDWLVVSPTIRNIGKDTRNIV
jgi:hypothetical protein